MQHHKPLERAETIHYVALKIYWITLMRKFIGILSNRNLNRGQWTRGIAYGWILKSE